MSLRHVTRRNTVDLSGAATFVHPLRGHLRLTDIDNTCTLQRIGHVRLLKGIWTSKLLNYIVSRAICNANLWQVKNNELPVRLLAVIGEFIEVLFSARTLTFSTTSRS
jgi:hypothetical protein